VDYVKLGVYAAVVIAAVSFGATANGYRWERKYNAREAEYAAAVGVQKDKALADQRAAELAKEKLVDDYQKALYEIENRAPATRIIRVCNRPAPSPVSVPAASPAGSPPAALDSGGADSHADGAVFDPEPTFKVAARCDLQLNDLIQWVKDNP
jgi:hypothetical protein